MPSSIFDLQRLELRNLLATTLTWQPAMEPGSGGFITSISVSPFDSSRVLVGGDMLGVGLSTNRGTSWQSTSGFNSWEIGSFTWHPTNPNVVWAGTMSGPYQSGDGGRTWSPRRTGMTAVNDGYYSAPVEKIVFDPANSNRLLAFGGSRREWNNQPQSQWNAVWQSTNGGSNWTRLSTVGTVLTFGVMAATYTNNSNLFAAVKDQGVFRSTNGGSSWALSNTGLPRLQVTNLVSDPRGNGTLYATLNANGSDPGGVYKSTNHGASWSAINTGLTRNPADGAGGTSRYLGLAVSNSNPSVLYTANDGWWNSGVFRSTNGGANWSPVMGNGAPVPGSFYAAGPSAFAIAVDPLDANAVFTGSSDKVLRSLDGGSTFTDAMSVQVPGGWRGTGFSGLVTTNVRFNPFADQTALLALDDAKLILSRDGLATFKWTGDGVRRFQGGHDVTFAGANGSTMYATFGQFGSLDGIAKSTNGGESWVYVTDPQPGGTPLGIYARPDAPDRVWAVVGGNLYRSTNGGSTWAEVAGNIANASTGFISAHPTQPSTFYVSSDQGVWRTADGVSFSLVPGSPTNVDRVLVDPTNPSRLYATRWRTYSQDGLWRFDGSSWSLVRADFAIQNVAVDPTNGNRIVVATNDDPFHDESSASGVWLSVDGGGTWSQQNAGLAMTRGQAIAFDPRRPGRIIFGTNGRGFFVTQLDSVAPTLLASSRFSPLGSSQTVSLNFSESLSRRPAVSDIIISNVITGQAVTLNQLNLTWQSNSRATLAWFGSLATGQYRLTIAGGSVVDQAANSNTQQSFEFGFLAGDFNVDGRVDFGDLVILARNFNRTSMIYELGDANYDGVVDFADLVMVSRNFNSTMPTAKGSASFKRSR